MYMDLQEFDQINSQFAKIIIYVYGISLIIVLIYAYFEKDDKDD